MTVPNSTNSRQPSAIFKGESKILFSSPLKRRQKLEITYLKFRIDRPYLSIMEHCIAYGKVTEITERIKPKYAHALFWFTTDNIQDNYQQKNSPRPHHMWTVATVRFFTLIWKFGCIFIYNFLQDLYRFDRVLLQTNATKTYFACIFTSIVPLSYMFTSFIVLHLTFLSPCICKHMQSNKLNIYKYVCSWRLNWDNYLCPRSKSITVCRSSHNIPQVYLKANKLRAHISSLKNNIQIWDQQFRIDKQIFLPCIHTRAPNQKLIGV